MKSTKVRRGFVFKTLLGAAIVAAGLVGAYKLLEKNLNYELGRQFGNRTVKTIVRIETPQGKNIRTASYFATIDNMELVNEPIRITEENYGRNNRLVHSLSEYFNSGDRFTTEITYIDGRKTTVEVASRWGHEEYRRTEETDNLGRIVLKRGVGPDRWDDTRRVGAETRFEYRDGMTIITEKSLDSMYSDHIISKWQMDKQGNELSYERISETDGRPKYIRILARDEKGRPWRDFCDTNGNGITDWGRERIRDENGRIVELRVFGRTGYVATYEIGKDGKIKESYTNTGVTPVPGYLQQDFRLRCSRLDIPLNL